MANKTRITIIGSANTDFIMKVPHLPALGETVTDCDFMQTFGGKGANQAVAAARAGGNVGFIGGLGTDAFGQQIRANLERDGINTTEIVTAKEQPTGSALIMFDHQGDNYISVAPGANYALKPEHIELYADTIRESAIIVMQMEIPVSVIRRVLEVAEEAETPVLFNFAPVRTLELPVSSAMTYLVINELEAEALTGLTVRDTQQAETAAAKLLTSGSGGIFITLGAQGCVAANRDRIFHVPAFPVTPVDTTAAGDVFCGALAVAIVEGKTLTESVRFSSAAASLSVTRMGAQPSIPTRAEIEAFLTP